MKHASLAFGFFMQHPTFIFVVVLIVILLAGNVFFAFQYAAGQSELREAQSLLTAQKANERTLAFATLFIEKVLQSDQEIEFDTRLQLENSVRAIGDEQILAQWKRFTESNTEEEAQEEVKNLLLLLMKKVGG